MPLSPLSGLSNNKSNAFNPGFGALKFELDKPTKHYIVKLAQDENLSSDEILEIAESADIFVKNLTRKANESAQNIIDDSELNGMHLEKVWPNDTVVKVNIKPKRNAVDNLLLSASFNDDFKIEENSENVYTPIGKNRESINIFAVWNFLASINSGEFKENIDYFVKKTLKKQSKFNELVDLSKQVIKASLNEKDEMAKQQIQKWIDS